MKVKTLISELQKCDKPDAFAYIWVDGERYNISMVDDGFECGMHVDINAEKE